VDGHRIGTVELWAQPQVEKQRRKAMMKLIQKLMRPVQNDEGANAIEYGLIAALISVTIIVSVTAVGDNLVLVFTAVSDALAAAL
jgi:pilus assembly protein Flp/PilA